MSGYRHGPQMLALSSKGQPRTILGNGAKNAKEGSTNRFSNLQDNDPGNLHYSHRVLESSVQAIQNEAVKQLKLAAKKQRLEKGPRNIVIQASTQVV